MKKILLLFLLLLPLSLFASCTEKEDDGKLDVVCSVFPLYDWTREIVGDTDSLDLHLLVNNGTDMHSYQASVQDIVTISECDIFIYVGGESDAWVEDVLRSHENPDRTVLRLLDYIECEDGACHSYESHSHTHEGEGYDEHIWLSLRNASRLTSVIADALGSRDFAAAALYAANAEAYIARLDALDASYAESVSASAHKILLFADRFPFAYLARDYELTCFAAFSGCSAESEASAATVRALAEKIDLYGLSCVLVLEDSSDAIATSVIAASEAKNARVLSVDSMQSITRSEIEAGIDYLSVMQRNLAVFKEALQ